MQTLSNTYIKETLADTPLIYDRGRQTWENGSYFLSSQNLATQSFVYEFDGNYGHYTTRIQVRLDTVETDCTCPYPGKGCRHVVAAAINAQPLLAKTRVQEELFPEIENPYLTEKEIREQALTDRQERSKSDRFTPIRGDMFKGDHQVISRDKREYIVCFHAPENVVGHCSCPDYLTNGLGVCKHMLFMADFLKAEPGFKAQTASEIFPFIDIYWDSLACAPRLFCQRMDMEMTDLKPIIAKYFNDPGEFIGKDISLIMGLMLRLHGDRRVRIREGLLKRVDHRLQTLQLEKMAGRPIRQIPLARPLYPFQKNGVEFGLLKTGVLIGDEMGLGKTVQAIAMALTKKEVFGFSKILVITLASLKDQWKQEIEQVSSDTACLIQGSPAQRRTLYQNEDHLFKITHYESVLRDVGVISAFNPDIIILDEAQRIRNFSTRTAEAVKRLPKKHAIVLTGTPLENKPEDLYSVVQFLDPYLFTPLWKFARDHFLIPRTRKATIAGFKNLDQLREKLKDFLIRRTREDVMEDLPHGVVNNYYIDLAPEQKKIHDNHAGRLGSLLRKKFLAPMDIRVIQTLLLHMRMVCNSTFLIDRKTQVSPKLRELASIIDEVVTQNQRKMVIFSEWTAMTFLVARHLSEAGIGFVEVSGKVDGTKRKALADQFSRDLDCQVFLSTDAGSAGLHLGAAGSAHCMVNVELPWDSHRAQRRQQRMQPPENSGNGENQPSGSIHIINLIGRSSIEEKILAGTDMETDLVTGLFDQGQDLAELSEDQRALLLNQLKMLLGNDLLALDTAEPEDIPEENPYFLPMDQADQTLQEQAESPLLIPEPPEKTPVADLMSNASPEQLEALLNSGMDFMGNLMEMATGKKLQPSHKKIIVDPKTGEITLSFKLPGF